MYVGPIRPSVIGPLAGQFILAVGLTIGVPFLQMLSLLLADYTVNRGEDPYKQAPRFPFHS